MSDDKISNPALKVSHGVLKNLILLQMLLQEARNLYILLQ